ncbi:unnamed protein product, partial [Mesorhabditis spiculigera]
MARNDETCPTNINVLGGGIRKECCDCCLLARELVRRNEPCQAPTGFSALCLRSFNRCCQSDLDIITPAVHIPKQPDDVTALLQVGDRCATSRCEHQCNDSGGDQVECSCREGYDLGSDGTSCIDIDECSLLLDVCLEGQRCLNVPGGYKCIRTLSCGTGYVMDSDTEQCTDVDECNLGSHDCGTLYQCKNTQGSYRCVPKRCGDGEVQNPQTGECTSINCPKGYYAKDGRCNDIDECSKEQSPCLPTEDCVNTPGTYRCQQRGNPCSFGYQVNPHSGFCEDIDECLSPNSCHGMECTNLPGTFRCKCPTGYEFDDRTKRCEDIDECQRFQGHVCDVLASCTNTVGSFICICRQGFELAQDQKTCIDIDECSRGIAHCAQKCVNIPGSYQCICDRGYALGPDGVTCEDIDECSLWSGTGIGNELCMGDCINTPGAYTCKCPPGYKIQEDGRTCVDIDECAAGECQGGDRVCVNTLGHFKCHRIECPNNYVHDSNYKNRCNRRREACLGMGESDCKQAHPVHITWQFIGLPKNVPLNKHRPSVTLFTIKGPSTPGSHVQFELVLKRASPEQFGVIPAVRANFLLQKGAEMNAAVVAMRDSLDGPQLVELELMLRLTKGGHFAGKYLANLIIHISPHEKRRNHPMPHVEDGWSCLKACREDDGGCLSNHTKELLYQFRSVPSFQTLTQPVEISRIRAQLGVPFSVEYRVDPSNSAHFIVDQERNIGIVKLAAPLRGPRQETVRIEMLTRSRTGVLLNLNYALIEVYISRHSF